MFGDCSLLCSVRSFYSARQSRHSRFARSHFVLLIESALCRIRPTARVAIALLAANVAQRDRQLSGAGKRAQRPFAQRARPTYSVAAMRPTRAAQARSGRWLARVGSSARRHHP